MGQRERPSESVSGGRSLYRDSSLPAEERAGDLLSRMTLEEKAAQMMCVWNEKSDTLVDDTGRFDESRARVAFKDGVGLGQVGRPSDAGGGLGPRESALLTNEIQQFFLDNTRLGIPVIFHEECLHGHAAKGSTSFPQPIALAATFDPDLVESLYAMTAEEAAARGTHQALTPVVDVARDARWGRVEETFGEDPYLVSTMGVAAVCGFQGDASFRLKNRVIATLKHFAAHGQPESGMNCAPVNISERELRTTFFAPFREAIVRGGALSVMASYNEIDGVPSHASTWLLKDVLRKEWGFDGFVVSDYYAIWELHYRPETHGHFVATDKREACRLAVRAGVNIELPEPDCYRHIVDLVEAGELDESAIDALVRPMLLLKFRMGLFDDPLVDPDVAEQTVGSERNRILALQAAREALVLLKNDGAVLPIDPDEPKSIAVIGPNAKRSLLGGYSGVPPVDVTVLDGIRDRVGEHVVVRYAEGCRITVGGSWTEDEVVLGSAEDDDRLIDEAVQLARESDVVVLALGGNEQTSREAWSRMHMGDRASLDLVGRQNDLVRAVVGTGRPVVALLFNGRPLSINLVADRVSAAIECFYLGQETGHAVADVLFGDYNPGGKLPITIPRSAGHVPAFYNHKPSARRGYLFDDVSPLFPFGFGLSYTSFRLSGARLEDPVIRNGGSTRVLVDVLNSGLRCGDEVVQMYIRDLVSSVTRPVKELKGFRRVTLDPGEQTTVALDISPASLGMYDREMRFVVEPGEFEIMVGTSSRDEDLQRVTLTVEG